VVAQITSVVNSTRANFRNETSDSKVVTVKALRPVHVAAVTQHEPFVLADVQPINVTAGGHPTPKQVTRQASRSRSLSRK
jgi:hypothetical protein